jgi:parallel beta-helix repeat protein
LTAGPAAAKEYFVDQKRPNACDSNPGTEAQPWKTIARAGKAKELQAGDSVLIRSGLYREAVTITVSGEPGKPITFAAAPGARVIVKGSELIRGQWGLLTERKDVKEPFPNAYKNVWRIPLGDEYFPASTNKAERFVGQVFMGDYTPLQMIGSDRSFDGDQLRIVGAGLADMIERSFYFDPKEQSLYVRVGGHPDWYHMEIGVRSAVVNVNGAHDVVLRGLEMRHNLYGGVCGVGGCQRVVVEDCACCLGAFSGLSICSCKDCTARRCDLSYNGNSGLGLNTTQGCTIEDCTLLFNNYRHFNEAWHCGGMKNIPDNRGTIVRRCEAAYTHAGPGIWFDSHNPNCLIVDNVCHHNDADGIFLEINRGGGVIANNLVYANRGRGIYVAGSPDTWVVYNTVVDNQGGIVLMPRGDVDPLQHERVLNNLLIRNYIAAQTLTEGCDLTLYMYPPFQEDKTALRQPEADNWSDFNVFAANDWVPTIRYHWNPNVTLPEWQKRFRQDLHSRVMPVPFERRGQDFKLLSSEGLDVAGPLPETLLKIWKPKNPKRVGATR